MTQKMKLYRQGDILLKQIRKMPDNLIPKDRILALGEATGHKHQFLSPQVQVYRDSSDRQYVKASQISVLSHEEHAPVEIDVGYYEVITQREFNTVSGYRQVMD